MKHAREDYNDRIQDSANLIPKDEPVFLFRTQDKYTPRVLVRYALLHMNNYDGNLEIAEKALRHAADMLQWQMIHGCKVADLSPASRA